jgi:hypothetical protein
MTVGLEVLTPGPATPASDGVVSGTELQFAGCAIDPIRLVLFDMLYVDPSGL